MSTTTNYPEIGTISLGTLRTCDLIPPFYEILKEYEPETAASLRAETLKAMSVNLDAPPDDDDPFWETTYAASLLNDDLIPMLDEIAPPYCHFGTLEGDGSDFGFWPDIDRLDEDAFEPGGTVQKVGAGGEPEFLMSVSDHGNVTLYAVTLEEVWSCV